MGFRCQETCLQHHENTKQQMQTEMLKQFNLDKNRLVENYTQQISQLK